MAFNETINTGTTPGDKTGDGLRTNMRKLIENDLHLLFLISSLSNINSLIIEGETFLWFKNSYNTTKIPELGDPVLGRIENYKYNLTYNSGNPLLLSSWIILDKQKLY